MLKISLLCRDAVAPLRKHQGDAGYDCYSPVAMVIEPGQVVSVPLGFACEFPPHKVLVISERSGHGRKGIFTLGNIVDSGYRGEVHCTIMNLSKEDFPIHIGHRICQFLLLSISTPNVEVVPFSDLSPTDRGGHGFGSTGK